MEFFKRTVITISAEMEKTNTIRLKLPDSDVLYIMGKVVENY